MARKPPPEIPADSEKDIMEINIELLLDRVRAVTEIDAKLARAKGTVAERKTKALDQVQAEDEQTEDGGLLGAIARLELELAEARQTVEDRVVAALKAMSGTSDVVEGLKAQRQAAVEQAAAVRTLLISLDQDVSAVVMPTKLASKGRSASSGVKVSDTAHYVIINGERKFYSNNTFSYLAFALKMTPGQGGNDGADSIATYLKTCEIDRTKAWEWSYKVPSGEKAGQVVTIGMTKTAK